MQCEKHTTLTLETMRVCRFAPATIGEHLHTLANTFLGWDSISSLYHNSPYLNLDELDENSVEDIQDNPINLFELPVDAEGDKDE